MHALASRIVWSSPAIRSSAAHASKNQNGLEHLYRRLSARDAKWLTRLILKNYQPLIFDSHLVYRSCDPILPFILKIQDDFVAAIEAIQLAKSTLLPNSLQTTLSGSKMVASIKPKLGIKVGRQLWLKGRSIKHCIDMGRGRMSVEDKIDGEYCQIHINVKNQKPQVQIFSKSGKDSTEDRQGLAG